MQILCLVLLSIVFCQELSAETKDDVLRLRYWQAPSILNPGLIGGYKDLEACRIVYEPLASYDAEGNLVPFLAAEIPSHKNGGLAADNKSVTWKLKPDVKWSDGHPFTAHDVQFTYEFYTNPDIKFTFKRGYDGIEYVRAIDDYTVKIVFKKITLSWPSPFVGFGGMIIPKHVFQAYNNADAKNAPANLKPVGTGPYRMTEFRKEEMLLIGDDLVSTVKIIFEPNPFFREKLNPGFKRIELVGGGDVETTAKAVLKDGLADFGWWLKMDTQALEAMAQKGSGILVPVPTPDVEWLYLNLTDPYLYDKRDKDRLIPHPFFRDKRVRQAFAHAIDREAIVTVFGKRGRPTTNVLVSPPIYRSKNTVNLYPFDLKRAAALLDEAGWQDTDGDGIRDKDGKDMKVVYQTSLNPLRQKIQQIVKNTLESIGVEVELKMIDASIFFSSEPANLSSFRRFYADMQEYARGSVSPHPIRELAMWSCLEENKNSGWYFPPFNAWCNPEYEALLKRAEIEPDLEKYRDIMIRMNDLLIEDVALIPLVNETRMHAVSKTLGGFKFTPWDASAWKIKDWRRKRE